MATKRTAEPPSTKSTFLFERPITNWYPLQPKPIRAIAFLLFVLTAVYAATRAVSGQYTVHGMLYEKRSAHEVVYAPNFEVQFGDKFFGTNSHGMYYLVMDAFEYAELMARGEVVLSISKDLRPFPDQTVQFDRLKQRFARVDLDVNGPPRTAMQSLPAGDPFAGWWHEADAAAMPGYRLFIGGLRVGEGSEDIRAFLSCKIDGPNPPLLSARGRDTRISTIPLATGTMVRLADDFYFPLATLPREPIRVTVSVRSAIVFRGKIEEFTIDPNKALGSRAGNARRAWRVVARLRAVVLRRARVRPHGSAQQEGSAHRRPLRASLSRHGRTPPGPGRRRRTLCALVPACRSKRCSRCCGS